MHRTGPWEVLMVLLAVTLSGCFSSTTKKLTESSAQSLLQDSVANKYDLISLSPIVRLFGKSRVDYKSFSGDGPGQVMRALLDKGLVGQQIETISYPNISGTFSGEMVQQGNMKYDPECVTKLEYILQMAPDSDTFSGTRTQRNCNGGSVVPGVNTDYHHGTRSLGPPDTQTVNGTVSPDGSIKFISSNSNTYTPAQYEEQGATATITMPGPYYQGEQWHLSGKASQQKVELKWYTYSFTPQGQSQIENGPRGIEARAGKIKIGAVTDLQLVTETDAAAHFAWEGSMNDFGNILTSNKGDRGTGEVEFRKKPDETWFVAESNLR
jgi:hypothetical protein